MRKLLILLVLAVLCGCTKTSEGVPDDNKMVEATTTTTPILSVPLHDSTNEFLDGKTITKMGDLVPDGVKAVVIDFYGMRLTLKSETAIEQFLNEIKEVPLYEEFSEDARALREIDGSSYAVELHTDTDKVVFVEDGEAIVVNKNKSNQKEYAYTKGTHTNYLHYVEEAVLTICPDCILMISSSEYGPNRFYMMSYETEDYALVNDVDLSKTFEYRYDVATTFDVSEFELFEDGVPYDALPNASGNHFVTLRKGDKEYYMYYFCE